MTSRKLVASYGINMNSKEMKRKTKGVIVGLGFIEGFELEFRTFLTIKRNSESKVPVVIWSISEEDERRLDEFEFVNNGLFQKEILKIKVAALTEHADQLIEVNSEGVFALAYIMNDGVEPVGQPTLEAYNLIFSAYIQNGIDITPLATALIKTWPKYDELELMKLAGYTEEEMKVVFMSLALKSILNIKN
ncbi:gamma-glutamylcyclotransferase family protein [Paenibacillus sp. DMB5]|uniref:gamma-glutamylcyclotransferase family protein n=1 Tax=Paenibacillus sp. DMB5 TaxID=1780103 RepID=UPI00076D5D1A|nr:gamma-glutamylcyclotransferase family protein [Paenibacillus sp. DMB5]KUP23088.1 hypothetical protein AWJ19_22690 [Paenibacillus sp. DMB5]